MGGTTAGAGVRTIGVEEELFLFDPASREVAAAAPAVLKEFHEHGDGRRRTGRAVEDLDRELFRHQLETQTDPETDLDAVLAQVVAARRTAGEAARAAGFRIGACGMVPSGGPVATVTADDRYRAMVEAFGEVARDGSTCAMHVHTSITSAEEGVAVIDRIAPWLPVLLAMSTNSPYVEGRDSTHDSWRAQVWPRWPTAGQTERFGSVAGYREVSRTLIELGAARDAGMLYFNARLSETQPTVEVRVCDVCTDPLLAVGIVGLVRALVETAAGEWRAGRPAPRWRAEVLRAAHWRASRHGMSGLLAHPESGALVPTREAADALVNRVGCALDEAGDLDLVGVAVERSATGNGASRQRAAFERCGEIAGVVDDLIARTEASWQRPDVVSGI